jgi:hypothetical protein
MALGVIAFRCIVHVAPLNASDFVLLLSELVDNRAILTYFTQFSNACRLLPGRHRVLCSSDSFVKEPTFVRHPLSRCRRACQAAMLQQDMGGLCGRGPITDHVKLLYDVIEVRLHMM